MIDISIIDEDTNPQNIDGAILRLLSLVILCTFANISFACDEPHTPVKDSRGSQSIQIIGLDDNSSSYNRKNYDVGYCEDEDDCTISYTGIVWLIMSNDISWRLMLNEPSTSLHNLHIFTPASLLDRPPTSG